MRPDMKNGRYEISNRFEFCLCLHEKVISGRPENCCMQFPCKIMFILKTNMAEKRNMEKQLLLTGTSNTLEPVDS